MVPLVIDTDSADIMASLLIMKAEVEDKIGSTMRMVFSGASEAHLLAQELGGPSQANHLAIMGLTSDHRSERRCWCYSEPSQAVPDDLGQSQDVSL